MGRRCRGEFYSILDLKENLEKEKARPAFYVDLNLEPPYLFPHFLKIRPGQTAVQKFPKFLHPPGSQRYLFQFPGKLQKSLALLSSRGQGMRGLSQGDLCGHQAGGTVPHSVPFL